jgi:hypothetical protein
VIAAPIIAHTDMFTPFDGKFFFQIFTGEVMRTVSHTLPIQLNVAYSFCWRERKRTYIFFKVAAKLKYKRALITSMGKHYPT